MRMVSPWALSSLILMSLPAAGRAVPIAASPKAEAAPVQAPAEQPATQQLERVKGMPLGYEDMTVSAIKAAAPEWNAPMLAAALEYEQAHGKRKGALAAIESAIAAKEEES